MPNCEAKACESEPRHHVGEQFFCLDHWYAMPIWFRDKLTDSARPIVETITVAEHGEDYDELVRMAKDHIDGKTQNLNRIEKEFLDSTY